ncbi:MAG: hypothetical protein COV99_09975 [Bacteroidetes bacterium CG12_big_fil_rev_8_21_14_0_65_60_17]|nr:MAG: hypothetical protein COV99_09975 [Bacteroidetes bacterium CG12_big_fil_rev_8_21_14_0_65_60_17]
MWRLILFTVWTVLLAAVLALSFLAGQGFSPARGNALLIAGLVLLVPVGWLLMLGLGRREDPGSQSWALRFVLLAGWVTVSVGVPVWLLYVYGPASPFLRFWWMLGSVLAFQLLLMKGLWRTFLPGLVVVVLVFLATRSLVLSPF